MNSFFGKVLLLLFLGYSIHSGMAFQFLLGLSADNHRYSGNMVNFERAGNYCTITFNKTIKLTAMLKGNPELVPLAGNLDTVHTFVNVLGQFLFNASFNEIFTPGKVTPQSSILNFEKNPTNYTAWTGALGKDCDAWTSNNPSTYGDIGDPNDPTQWIYSGSSACGANSGTHVLFCIARIGTGQGDPHFVGFNGCKFEFDGQSDTFFSIYSDLGIQVNAFFEQITHLTPSIVANHDATIGHEKGAAVAVSSSNVIGTGNWMTKFGIQLDDQQFVLDPKYGLLHVNTGLVHKTATQLTLEKNIRVHIEHDGRLVKSAVIETERLLIRGDVKRFSSDSDTYFINIGFEIRTPPVNPHGVLGQTARHIAATPGLPLTPCGTVEGFMEDYIVDSLLGTGFTYARFHI